MNRKALAIVGIALAVGLVAFLLYARSVHGVDLVANEKVRVYATIDDARAPSAVPLIELSAGAVVPITKCIDVKQYVIYELKLPDGRQGYVLDGKYSITRNGRPTSCT